MRVVGRAIATLCVLGVAVLAAAADRGLKGHEYVEDEVIVKFKPGVIAESVHAAAPATVPGAFVAKSMVVRTRGGIGQLALLRAPHGQAKVAELVARFSALPDVEYAAPNYLASIPAEAAAAAKARPWPARTFGPSGNATTRGGMFRKNRAAGETFGPPDAESAREVSGEDLMAMGWYPDESYYQWGWDWIDSAVIWSNKNASPLVAVIDTGVDYTHPDLKGRIVKGYNFVEATTDPMDDHGHGTHVAGVIAARLNNKIGISGISNGKVLAIKALDFSGFGTYYEIAEAIYYAANNAAVKVINMSLGGYSDSTTLYDAVTTAVVDKNKLLVAAAGNDNTNARLYPAGYSDDPALLDRVLAVAASGVYVTGSFDGYSYFVEWCKADYSNYGTWVNITAPGTDITSTMPTRPSHLGIYDYGTLSGTSMATPHVAGTAARVWSVNPSFTNVQIAQRLTGGGGDPAYLSSTWPVDVDYDGIDDLAQCWDTAWATTGGADGRTLPDLKDASVATGMQRGVIDAWIYDATNGLALPTGTVLQAFQGAAMKGQGKMDDWVGQQYVVVSNLPWDSTTPYTLKVKKTGYTSGSQVFGSVYLYEGWVYTGFWSDLALPKRSSNRTFVTNWATYGNDVDQHLLLPPGSTAFDVGTDFGGAKTTITALPPNQYGTGTLVGTTFPQARYMADSYFMDWYGVETTAVKTLYPTTTGPYRLFNRDYTDGEDISYGYLYGGPYSSYYPVGPTMRLWQNGVIKATVSADEATVQSSPACTFDAGAAVCDKWYVGDLNSAGVFTPVNEIGDGSNGAIVPFGGANAKGGIATVPEP